jgi:hypothetical protein
LYVILLFFLCYESVVPVTVKVRTANHLAVPVFALDEPKPKLSSLYACVVPPVFVVDDQ